MVDFESFDRDGYAVVERAIPESMCADLLQLILSSCQRTESDFILQPNFRLHCPMPMNALTRRAITVALEPAYKAMDQFLAGPQDLVELSSITVFPHAAAQELHADEQNPGTALVSVFINLAPTREETGALRIVPGSHKDLDRRFTVEEAQVVELPQGSAVFMNSKTWHGGGPNTTWECIRPVFYFSLGQPNLDGPTYSISDDVAEEEFQLSDFQTPDDQRQTEWRLDSRPRLRDGVEILSPLSQANRLLLSEDNQLAAAIHVPDEQPWIADMVRNIAEMPAGNSVLDFTHQFDVDESELLSLFNDLGRSGWCCWADK